MKEFGSDFHYIESYQRKGSTILNIFPSAVFLADGRMCLQALIAKYKWKRIWLPQYFCYEVIDTILNQSDIELMFYIDYPGCDDTSEIGNIQFEKGDVLFRVNYFGMRDFRSEKELAVPVIEDHTHDVIGPWAVKSDADWCIASLRKTLPIPEGGLLWSPKGYQLDETFEDTLENEQIAAKRWKAMELKRDYLNEKLVEKDAFRSLFLETEEWFDTATISRIDKRTLDFLCQFDIISWYSAKKSNIERISRQIPNAISPENPNCNLFSLVLQSDYRSNLRKELIDSHVYTAILWNVPDNVDSKVKQYSQSMISVHCDGRYSTDDLDEIANRIKKVL